MGMGSEGSLTGRQLGMQCLRVASHLQVVGAISATTTASITVSVKYSHSYSTVSIEVTGADSCQRVYISVSICVYHHVYPCVYHRVYHYVYHRVYRYVEFTDMVTDPWLQIHGYDYV